MKKILGYILFILSFVAWGVIAVLPFLELKTAQIASFTTILLILGEVFFWSSLLFLGKEFWLKIKAFFIRQKNKLLKKNLINKETQL